MAIGSRHTIPTKVARRYFTFTVVLTFAILFLAYVSTTLINLINWESSLGRGPRELVYYKYILDDIEPERRLDFLKRLENSATEKWMDFTITSKPVGPVFDLSRPTSPPPFSLFPTPPHREYTFELKGHPPQFINIKSTRNIPALFKQRFIINFTILTIAVILGVLATLAYVFRTIRAKMKIADTVIHSLQQGDLKARIPIDSGDEFRATWLRFNTMAGEIENLVINLKTVEQTRKHLLSELAHDLRTPIASLKISIETLQSNFERIAPEKRMDMLAGTMREIDYFSSLVEDLLFLGQVTEPKYRTTISEVNLNDLLQDEADAAEERHAHAFYELELPLKDCVIYGDQKLLHRLFRNALDNAFAFTTKKVNIRVSCDDEFFAVDIADDGPGFSDEQITNYGQKRFTRSKSGQGSHPQRISVGLGSVIIRSIVEIYRGDLTVSNNVVDGKIKGARLYLRLPQTLAFKSTSPLA